MFIITHREQSINKITHSLFYVLVLAQACMMADVMAPRTRTIKYRIISDGGTTKVLNEQGDNMLATARQRVTYDLIINQNGSLSFEFSKNIIPNYTMINKINNFTGYNATYSLADKGRSVSVSGVIPPGSTLFKQVVPWNRDNNYFVLEVTVN